VQAQLSETATNIMLTGRTLTRRLTLLTEMTLT